MSPFTKGTHITASVEVEEGGPESPEMALSGLLEEAWPERCDVMHGWEMDLRRSCRQVADALLPQPSRHSPAWRWPAVPFR